MRIQLRYFASVREALGRDEEGLDTDAATVSALRELLIARGGAYALALSRERPVRAALNHRLVDENAALSEGCELAFFPPVTGG